MRINECHAQCCDICIVMCKVARWTAAPVLDAAALLAAAASDEEQLWHCPCDGIQGGTIFLCWFELSAHG